MIQFIGPIGTSLTTISFLPQIIQVLKTRDVSEISLGMYITFVLGVILWTIYGFILNDITIIASNGITTILATVILYSKWNEPKEIIKDKNSNS